MVVPRNEDGRYLGTLWLPVMIVKGGEQVAVPEYFLFRVRDSLCTLEGEFHSLGEGKEGSMSIRPLFLAMAALLGASAITVGDAPQKKTSSKEVRKDLNGVPLPDGAILRLGVKSKRDPPIGIVSRVAFSPDGKMIATTCPRDQIFLWNAVTGEHVESVNSYDFDFFAGGWDKEITSAPKELRLHAPDGKFIVSLSRGEPKRADRYKLDYSTKIVLQEKDSGKLLRSSFVDMEWSEHPARRDSYGPHGVNARRLAVSPDGRRLAGVFRSQIGVWDLDVGLALRRVNDIPGGFSGVVFSADGRSLISIHSYGIPHQDKFSFFMWEVASGKERAMVECGGFAGEAPAAFAGERLAAIADNTAVHLVDPRTGHKLARFNGHDRAVSCLAFSHDRKLLATGSHDTSVVVWTVPHQQVPKAPKLEVNRKEITALWTALADTDAAKAYQAIVRLSGAGDQAMEVLGKHLQPAKDRDGTKLRGLLADLDHDQFARRENATKGLLQLGELAEIGLRELMQNPPSLESRRRAESIIAKLKAKRANPEPLSPPVLQAVRAVEVLEMIGTPDAQRLLDKLAKGAAYNILTREAQASIRRLKK
jgi:WD40 repeat protein